MPLKRNQSNQSKHQTMKVVSFRMKSTTPYELDFYFPNSGLPHGNEWVSYNAGISPGTRYGVKYATVFENNHPCAPPKRWKVHENFDYVQLYWHSPQLSTDQVHANFPQLRIHSGKGVVIVRHVIPGIFYCVVRLICLFKRVRLRLLKRKLFLRATLLAPLRQIGTIQFSKTKQIIYNYV